MSTFLVESRRIEKVWKHPNADRLQLAKVEGLTYQFVVGKGDFTPGDIVIYFPVDSMLSDDLIATINSVQQGDIRSYLHGKYRNRIKTIKLRQEISQGLCLRPEVVGLDSNISPGVDVTFTLGVAKYESSPSSSGYSAGRLEPRHSKVSLYDIEGTERYSPQLEILMDSHCFVTEKLEGMNVSVLREANGDITICSRNCTVKRIPGTFWGRLKAMVSGFKHLFAAKKPESQHYRAVKNSGILEGIERLYNLVYYLHGCDVIVRGEVVGPGVQGNIYKLDYLSVFVFDIQINGKYVDAGYLMHYSQLASFSLVPILSYGVFTLKEWLEGKSVDEASNGKSTLYNTLREGIVIRPLEEMNDPRLGRMILKKRSPEYLAVSDM